MVLVCMRRLIRVGGLLHLLMYINNQEINVVNQSNNNFPSVFIAGEFLHKVFIIRIHEVKNIVCSESILVEIRPESVQHHFTLFSDILVGSESGSRIHFFCPSSGDINMLLYRVFSIKK